MLTIANGGHWAGDRRTNHAREREGQEDRDYHGPDHEDTERAPHERSRQSVTATLCPLCRGARPTPADLALCWFAPAKRLRRYFKTSVRTTIVTKTV